MHAVEGVELVTVEGVDTRDVGGEGGVESRGDVHAGAPRLLRHAGPAPQGVLGFDERLLGINEEPVVGEGETGGTASRRSDASEWTA